MFRVFQLFGVGICGAAALAVAAAGAAPPSLAVAEKQRDEAFALLKTRCVRCHGPAKQDGGLNLSVPTGIVRGGKSGPVLSRQAPDQGLLWRRVAAGEMPPGEPLSALDKETLRRWLQSGAPGLPARVTARPSGDEHWASQPLRPVTPPSVRTDSRAHTPIDRFIQSRLETRGLTLNPEASPEVLIRRVTIDLTGLPPTPEEVEAFVAEVASRGDAGAQRIRDRGNERKKDGESRIAATAAPPPTPGSRLPSPYDKLVNRLLASPRYGERWGKYWLDAAGYADSNGYFNADTDRPLAYRYRDYVVRSLNADKPWSRFIQEQLAGDELVGYRPGVPVEPGMVEALEATHFLRNSQDGTDSSDGNPDERRADKYAALEGAQQIIGSSLLGTTVQCARCHDHKFEPFSQKDYYSLQAVLYPAFNIEKWVTPGKRELDAATPAEVAAWEQAKAEVEGQIAAKRRERDEWARMHRETGKVLFHADFDAPSAKLEADWSNTAPGDRTPAGTPAINLDSAVAPGAQIAGGRLRIHESGSPGDRALSTRRAFNWAPEAQGAWIQATFDLVAEGTPAPYVGYFLGLRDFSGTTGAEGGNILLDGNAAGGAAVHVGYPARPSVRGTVGKSGYTPGRSYGVRVTNLGSGQFEVAQVVDGIPEEGTVRLTARDLPAGGFGFEYCCSRSFVVDNVRIEASEPAADPAQQARLAAYRKKRGELDAAIKALEARRPARPGKLAAVTDLSSEPPKVPLLVRGDYKSPGELVDAAAPMALSEPANPAPLSVPVGTVPGGTGRRLALARWMTRPGSRAEARLARVTVNRWWQHHFGAGLVATPDNLGYSGAPPTHPELLEYLAGRLVRGGWSAKALHREILLSAAYRQSSVPTAAARRLDEDNRLLSHFPLLRLDAEAIRDSMLAVSSELDPALGGPYVPTSRSGEGEVVVAESTPGARRRSLYLQQRRTQVTGLLDVFDAPSVVFNCTFRNPTTVPLQSLTLLNSPFIRARAAAFAERLRKEAGDGPRARIRRAFILVHSRPPSATELTAAETFIAAQVSEYGGADKGQQSAWTDFCQSLLASNEFLYVR